MFSIQPKKIVVAFAVLLVAAASMFIASCQKEFTNDGFNITETPPDLSTKVATSVSGFVTDENEAPVTGATVQFGASNTTTDKYGYFSFRNVQAIKNAAVVTVIKPGYFKGIKSFIAAEGHSGFFRIKLLAKTNAGNFDAATGGTVSLSTGLSITFPADAIAVASSNAPYTGQVSVAVQWLDPTANDINRTMPGDLRGIDSLGFMKVLTSFGMSATELTGASGELLQIKNGKKAAITFPLPSAIASSAPATIPMWHFDETNGLWKQEGNAVKSGATYVGEVSHFSYWNCDLANSTVPLTFNVVDAAGHPVSNVYVDIRPVSGWSHAGGYTDSTGHVGILVTANTDYTLAAYGDCGVWSNPNVSQNFSVGTAAVNLPDVVILSSGSATVSGTVECGGTPLSNAYVIVNRGYSYYRFPVNSDGTYNFTMPLCGTSGDVTILAENLSTLQSGTPLSTTFTSGNNTVPPLQACTISADEFVNYTINGASYAIISPADSLYHGVNTQAVPPTSIIYGGGNAVSSSVNITFDQTAIATGSTQALVSFYASGIPDSSNTLSGNPLVNITEYGNVGEYIAGNFNCTVLSGIAPSITTYAVTCSFRVRRRL